MDETHLWQAQPLILGLRDEGTPGFGADELLPWLAAHPEVIAELQEIGRPESHRRAVDDEVSFGLYAVSRLVEILISPFQPVVDDPALLAWTTGKPWWSGPIPSATAWAEFRRAVGAVEIAEDAFHPFFHEVVRVVPADDPDEPVSMVEQVWPGALVGGMVLARSGVVVRAGASALDPTVAAKSCLYWAWWRRNRLVRDNSHGWGGSSQWGTDFRRDYVVGDELHYNVGVRLDPRLSKTAEASELSADDRRELLRWRHSRTVDVGTEEWPYYDWLVEPRA
ncbi:MAG: hypothetical protein HOU81_06625 [Hamadaea sp.]|uniref:hypothetical protein n=1 Tax=Hamadaea sp. TaxID=2024425 RepID=UPI0017A68607|nr:hypothetical protein [Hamadaea sp.]NUR70475.1 hypothetical protein [Hamadaea sp.]NUT18082.1 hypothetical protein [Hamadaea sp.]